MTEIPEEDREPEPEKPYHIQTELEEFTLGKGKESFNLLETEESSRFVLHKKTASESNCFSSRSIFVPDSLNSQFLSDERIKSFADSPNPWREHTFCGRDPIRPVTFNEENMSDCFDNKLQDPGPPNNEERFIQNMNSSEDVPL